MRSRFDNTGQPNRLASGGSIDRSRLLEFSFNGMTLTGYRGDTVASALLANDVRVIGRSFKYHRPRGVVGAGAEDPNSIIQVGTGVGALPNMRATQFELYYGLTASSVNCWPSAKFDVGALNGLFSRILPAGFYYKTFMWPERFWMWYERQIRRAAGLGTVPTGADPDHYDRYHTHCDVLIAGAGPGGLAAALAAGRSGARVIIADEQHELGGSLLARAVQLDGVPAQSWVGDVLAELSSLENVRLLPRTTVFGYYSHNFLGLLERRYSHLPPGTGASARERVWRVRAKRVVIATGAIERPLVFCNNDRPGVMTASAVSTYINRYAVAPGRRAVVFTNNDSAYETARDLARAGVSVASIVDVRSEIPTDSLRQAKQHNIQVVPGHAVVDVKGGKLIRGVEVMPLSDDGQRVTGTPHLLNADLVAVSGGWNPVVHLHSQSGGAIEYDRTHACFIPGPARQACQSIGACSGSFQLSECLREGVQAGALAAAQCGFQLRELPTLPSPAKTEPWNVKPMWLVPSVQPTSRAAKKFVDFQNDTSAADLLLAVREGYHSVEHVKRYTAMGFGTDQGKLGNINGAAIVAGALGKELNAVGTTTFRPAYTPVTFGAIAAGEPGELFDPVRKTAMHKWHLDNGAEFENVGQWKRPWYYPRASESMHDAVDRECLAARNGVAILDASTLGKIDIRGPDAAEFLDRIYTNGWKKLAVGRCRYGFMLGEDGMVMDDGVTSRVGDTHYHMTTTTGGAANVMSWMERWLQTEWPELKVYLTSVTDQWATVSLAGPHSRALMQTVCEGIDFSAHEMPFMSVRAGTAAGVAARVFRISFSGELAYEINVNANHGQHVWDACMGAGKKNDITPYGTEAMHVLRAEKGFVIVGQDTDGSVTPQDLGMDWICAKHKDFIGKRSLIREDTVRTDRKQLVGLRTRDAATVLPEGAQLTDRPGAPLPIPMIGHVSSSYYSVCLGHSIALALVKGSRERIGETVFAPLADGRVIEATLCSPVFYDSEGARQHA
jgi:sarcosine oxidase subunit alpha